MTVYAQTCNKLAKLTSSQSVELDGLILLELVTGKNRVEIATSPNLKLSKNQEVKLEKLIKDRTQKPIAYLTNSKEFFNLNFIVNENVLIPRPESESLVELGLKFCRKPKFIYDVGAGSGCLAISYCLNSNNTNPILIDKEYQNLNC